MNDDANKKSVFRKFFFTLNVLMVSLGVVSTTQAAGDSRIAQWEYDANKVYTLEIPTQGHIHISVEEGERFINLGAGNTSVIDVGAEGSQVVIKAKEPVKHTNLTLITDRRVYIFDYSSNPSKSGQPPNLYSIRFIYPHSPSASLDQPKSKAPVAGLLSEGDKSERKTPDATANTRKPQPPKFRNDDYWYQGPAAFKPLEVYDNGLHTIIQFEPQLPLPSMYVVESDGSESLVNLHVLDDHLVLHRVAPRWVLKRGSTSAIIENRSFNGHGVRAASGTIDDDVNRSIVMD